MLTAVSKSASSSSLTNPVMVYVKVGSVVTPYTFEIPESAVTVNGAAVISPESVGCVSV